MKELKSSEEISVP